MKKLLFITIPFLFLAAACNNQQAQVQVAQNQPTAVVQSSPTPTIDPTANWKTFKNDTYGFEVKYPENLIAVADAPADKNAALKYRLSIQNSLKDVTYFNIDIWNDQQDNSFVFKGPYPTTVAATEVSGPENVDKRVLAGINGVEVYGSTSEGHNYADQFYFKNNNYTWVMQLAPVIEGRISENNVNQPGTPIFLTKDNESTYKGIINSFKLTK